MKAGVKMSSKKVYKESKFQKTELKGGMSETNIEKSTFEDKFGQDALESRLEQDIKAVKQTFSEKYGVKKLKKGDAKDKVKSAYRTNINANDKLSFIQKTKRGKAAVEKASLQQNLVHEKEILLAHKKEEIENIRKHINPEEVDALKDVYQDPEELQAVREWLFAKSRYGNSVELKNKLADRQTDERISIYQDIFRVALETDIKKFAYTSDTDFVSGFAVKYNEICKQVAVGPLLKRFLAENNNNADITNVTKVAANVEFFEKLKTEYEDRMKLISSPYYALVAAKDLKKYKSAEDVDPGADAEFKEFVALYIKLSESSLGKGKTEEYRSAYDSILARKEEERYDLDCKRIKDYYEGVELKDLRELDEEQKAAEIEKLFNEKIEYERSTYPDDPAEFLEKIRFENGGNFLEGIDAAPLMNMEKRLLEVSQTGMIFGTPIEERVFERFKDTFSAFIDMRKDYISTYKGWDLLNRAQTFYGADEKNGKFKASEEYAKIEALVPMEGYDPKYEQSARSKKEDYVQLFQNCFIILSSAGYQISAEEQKITQERAAKAIEEERVRTENKYYADHPEENVEGRKKIDFKTFTVAGKVFTDYRTNKIFAAIADGKIKLTEKQEQLLYPYINELDSYQTDFCVIKSMFGTEGDDKKLTEMIRNKINTTKMQEIESKIKSVLSEQD